MRILYLHQYFNTPSGIGGTRSYEMARRLVADGHEVTVVTSSARLEQDRFSSPGWYTHDIEGIHLEVMCVPYSNEMSFPERIKAFFSFALGASWHLRNLDADVVFATSTPLTIAVPAMFAKLWHRIPMVFEVRDLWPELPIAVGALRNPLGKLLARGLEWSAYHASAHIVALSSGMAEGVMRRGIPPSRVTVIPNSCDLDLFNVPAENGRWVREKLGLESEQPLIVYTGAFGLINGVGYLVDVAAAMRDIAPDVSFLLVGRGAEVEKVTAQAQELGVLNQNLWIWAPLPKAQVPDLLAAATVATSLFIPLEPMWNNSANKFFDALASGTPLAINYGGWQAELLEKKAAGVVLPPEDLVEAAQRLADFAHDEERLGIAARACRQLALGPFNRDLLYVELERVLRNVVYSE
ncbi:MAG: glycosyltransferase family 4 protein, partial [Anaerolineae bacterium]